MAANSSFLVRVRRLFLGWVALRDLGDRPFKCMFMSLTLHYPQCRLQTDSLGKPQGTVARVHIGQVIMSMRTKLQNKQHVIEDLCRAKFKLLGCQKIHISKKWCFTKFKVD